MQEIIRDIKTSERLEWGDKCFVWYLLNDKELTVMKGVMPPNTSDILHYHDQSNQFLYLISGILHIELNEQIFTLNPFQGLKIPAKISHCVKNNHDEDAHYLLMSVPGQIEDRVVLS